MKSLLPLIVIIAIVAAILYMTGGIFIGKGRQDGLRVNGRSVAEQEVCRYLTLEGIKTVAIGARVGGLSIQVGEGCPLTLKQATGT